MQNLHSCLKVSKSFLRYPATLLGDLFVGPVALLSTDSPAHPLRRSLIKAQIGNTSLEAKVFALEQKLKRRDEELEADRQEIEKLMQDRRNLNRGYESAISASNQARQELEAEKVGSAKASSSCPARECSPYTPDAEWECLRTTEQS
jgi:chromosome segregation ATPase